MKHFLALIHLELSVWNLLLGILFAIKCLASFLMKNGWPFPTKSKKYDVNFVNINVDSFSETKNEDRGVWYLMRQNKFFP